MSNVATTSEARRCALQLWMEERRWTAQWLADAMGVSRQFVKAMLERDTMPAKRHKQMVRLGVPEELLPPVYTGPMGRPCIQREEAPTGA